MTLLLSLMSPAMFHVHVPRESTEEGLITVLSRQYSRITPPTPTQLLRDVKESRISFDILNKIKPTDAYKSHTLIQRRQIRMVRGCEKSLPAVA